MAGDDAKRHSRPDDEEKIREKLADVKARIATAAARAGRDPGEIRLLPVSKTVPAERLRSAYAAGLKASCTLFSPKALRPAA